MIIPRTPHLFVGTPPAAVVLPPGGVFTDQPFYDITEGAAGLSFYVVYTRGAVGGRPRFRFQWGNVLTVPGGGEEVREVSVVGGSGQILDPNCQFDLCLTQFQGPIPPDGTPLSYLIPVCAIPPGARKVRLLAAESGVPATPGSMLITLTGQGP